MTLECLSSGWRVAKEPLRGHDMVLAKVQMEGARPRNGGQLMLPAKGSTGKPISIKYAEVLFFVK